MIVTFKANKADLIGILNSSFCLIHCIATPILMAFGFGVLANPAFEYVFLLVCFFSIFRATQCSKNDKTSVFLWICFWGFVVCTLFQDEFFWLEFVGYFFSILIVLGHLFNINTLIKSTNNIK
ncbi:MAG: hypothetical protein C4K58_06630 [Flavobacteriaceae bacterium]|nr:MAG: hypothetical protein C4K58_06630 [Flavobacteriaceae bacterium]